MSQPNRSRQASELAYQLTQRTGQRVDCRYLGHRQDWYGGWHVEWADGPTVSEMMALAAEYAEQLPAIVGAKLRYTRGSTDLGEAVALLMNLNAHPGELAYLDSFVTQCAHDRASYPERAEEIWQRRGRALIAAGGRSTVGVDTLEVLRAHVQPDWVAALAWLDGLHTEPGRLRVLR